MTEEQIDQTTEETQAPVDAQIDSLDTERTGRRMSVRESLQKSFKDAHQAEEKAERARDKESGQFTKEKKAKEAQPVEEAKRPVDQVREAASGGDGGAEPAAEPAVAAEEAPAEEAPAKPEAPAPAAWAKDAKAKWADLPPEVQAAVAKREQDVQKGVDSLKAQYADLDAAIAPHAEVIKKFGHNPSTAVRQMFAWFQALDQHPAQAFPQLLQQFNQKPEDLFPALRAQTPPADPAAPAGAPDAAGNPDWAAYEKQNNERWNAYREALNRHVAQMIQQNLKPLQDSLQERQQADANVALGAWAKDKPYFEDVRQQMSQLVGTGIVPLKDGQVDLDGAYNAAIRMNPDVWEKIQGEENAKRVAAAKAAEAAKVKAAADAVAKAKAASSSLAPTSPTTANLQAKPKKGKSVRESLLDSIAEHRS
jgi:hypothetical protein